MDCIEAQSAISAAVDRAQVDSVVLEEAKGHCKTCSTCGAFVRTLSAAKRSPLPEPPSDLPDRIMAAVRAEALADRLAVEAAARPEAGHGSPASNTAATARDAGTFGHPALALAFARKNRRQLVIWGSAAAVLLALAGVAAVNGVREITGVDSTSNVLVVDAGRSAGTPMATVPESAGTAAKTATGSASGSTLGTVPSSQTAAGLSLVTISGDVYRLSGPAALTRSQLRQVGTASTARAGGGSPKERTVFAGSDPARVFLEDDKGKLLAFDRVVRVFRDITYQQQASAIPSFGTWPSLPAQITAPTTPDGSPTFVEEGVDAAGVKVYRLAIASASMGIGIAPGTSSGDPAAGNPNWTWWVPVQ